MPEVENFTGENVPFAGVDADDGPRREADIERMRSLAPLGEGGRDPAALASKVEGPALTSTIPS
ncbi:MAG: hypothetical protein ABW065_01910 [Solirubrobacterales bacterium]